VGSTLKTILDVGCGSKPWGNINLDLFQGASIHHRYDYTPKDIERFVNGDGSRLPFRDKSIDVIVSRHCLEHIPEPLRAVKDWERVARKAVVIMVPNNPTLEEYREHLYSWSVVSFKHFLEQVFPEVQVWANSPLEEINKDRFSRRLLRIKLWKKPMQRFVSRWMGLQITAVCYCLEHRVEAPAPVHVDHVEAVRETASTVQIVAG
jgi:SAM-dependent methyltransferase